MKLGLRVVRGSDWKWNDQDGGEGYMGTVVQPGMQECDVVLHGTVFIQWDCGQLANYRVGQGNAYDLRLFDCATAGSIHVDSMCSECKLSPIVGTRWQCSNCSGVVLCHDCYRNDKHLLTHSFVRFDWPSSEGCHVPSRQSSRKVDARGIFAGATVVRGPDWRWGDQDGGEGSPGLVLHLSDRQESFTWHSWCTVAWNTGETNGYRCGHDGKLDVLLLQAASAGFYYPEHLAKLGADGSLPVHQSDDEACASEPADSENKLIKSGDRVQIELDAEVCEAMQQGHGGWNSLMSMCIGRTGRVVRMLDCGDALVRFTGIEHAWRVNPDVLSPAGRRLRAGDKVQVSSDLVRVMQLQEGHGGWVPQMQCTLGQIGSVISEDNDGDIRINVRGMCMIFNPVCLTLIPSESDKQRSAAPVAAEVKNPTSSDEDSDDDGCTIVGQPGVDQLLRSVMHRERIVSGPLTIIEAAGAGDVDTVRSQIAQLSAASAMMDRRNILCLALKAASQHGQVEVAQLLIDAGTDVRARDETGASQAHFAVSENHPEVLDVLLRGGVDIDLADFTGLAPLHIAVHGGYTESVVRLVQLGCNVNVTDSSNNTALHDAVRLGASEIVDVLTDVGVEFDYRKVNSRGFTVLHEAAVNNNTHAVERILERAPSLVDVQKVDGMTPLHCAVTNGSIDVVDTLLRKGKVKLDAQNSKGQTALILSICNGWASLAELFVIKGANVNLCDGSGNSALHVNLTQYKQDVDGKNPMKSVDKAAAVNKILLSLPSELRSHSWIAMACFLIQHGADVGLANFSGQTPLDCLADQAVAEILVKYIKTRQLRCKCQMCSKNAAITFLPCGHQIVCNSCSLRSRTCPTCKRPIIQRIVPDEIAASKPLPRPVPVSSVVQCNRCLQQRGFLLRPCLHTCCKACAKDITTLCPICQQRISAKVELFCV